MRRSKTKEFFSIKLSKVPAKRFAMLTYGLCYIATVAPPFYFLLKNYQFLDELGYKAFPSLLAINNQDKINLLIVSGVSFVVGLIIHMYAQRKFLKRIYKPLDEMQIHMSNVIHGDFSQDKINTRDQHYLEELVKTYNYLYSALQSNLKRDLTFLKELESAHDPELTKILINEKIEQLKFQAIQKSRQTVLKKDESEVLKIAN